MTEPRPRSFAAKLAHVIATVHPPDRAPYSYREMEAGIQERGLAPVSGAYLNQLVKERRTNPAMSVIESIAGFFGVPPGYFFDDEVAANIDNQLEALARWRDSEAIETAERIMQLGPRDRRTVVDLIESLQQYEEQPRDRRTRRKPATRD
jgi:transcriptional regulator with XRE-family HTH domain